MIGLIGQFLVCAGMVVLAGIALSQFGDVITQRTKLSGMLVGGLLIAGTTSLPELSVNITAVRLGSVDLAVGDLFGSCLVNLLILAVVDLTRYSHGRMLSRTSAAHALSAGVSICLIATAALFIHLGPKLESAVFFRIGPGTLILGVLYLAGFRLIHHSRIQSRNESENKPENTLPVIGKISLKVAVIGFSVAAAVIVVVAPLLAKAADKLAEETGLGGTFFGTTFLAVSTSLPDAAAVFAAVRLRAFDIALGNIFGAICLNMAMLPILDVIDPGSLLSSVSPTHVYSGLCVIIITSVVILGQLYRVEKKKPFLEPDALLALALIIAAFTGLYFVRG